MSVPRGVHVSHEAGRDKGADHHFPHMLHMSGSPMCSVARGSASCEAGQLTCFSFSFPDVLHLFCGVARGSATCEPGQHGSGSGA